MRLHTTLILALISGTAFVHAAPPSEAPLTAGTCCRAGEAALPGQRGLDALEWATRLAGTWVEVGADGAPTDVVASRYEVTAGGNAVLETLFPGTEKEMVSLYHVDGDTLVLTHYCVLGAHPRMSASIDADTGELVFTCTGEGLNFRSCDDVRHMHENRVRRVGEDRLESVWTPWSDGKPEEPVRFVLARVAAR